MSFIDLLNLQNKPLLVLKCLAAGVAVDPNHPLLHIQKVKFLAKRWFSFNTISQNSCFKCHHSLRWRAQWRKWLTSWSLQCSAVNGIRTNSTRSTSRTTSTPSNAEWLVCNRCLQRRQVWKVLVFQCIPIGSFKFYDQCKAESSFFTFLKHKKLIWFFILQWPSATCCWTPPRRARRRTGCWNLWRTKRSTTEA